MAKFNKTFNVEGMSCMHCVSAIKKAVSVLNGVENVEVDLKSKKVLVEFDNEKVLESIIKETIEDQGYNVK
jgi:copper chaperone